MCLKLVRGEQHQLESRSRLPRVVSIGTYSCPEVDDLSTRCEDVWTVLHTIYVGLDRGSDLEFPFVPRRNDSPLSAEAGEFGEALTLEGPRKGFVVSGKHWNYSTIGTR